MKAATGMTPVRASRIHQVLALLACIAPLTCDALSSTSPQDLFAHPRYQLVITQHGVSNATASELLAREVILGETAYHLLRTNAGQGFLCTVPPSTTTLIQPSAAAAAEERRRQAREDKQAGLDRGLNLLEPLKGSCLYLRQGWFTYAFCHGNEIRQFHEIRQPGSSLPAEDPNSEAYTLGQYAQPQAEVVAGSGTGALQDVLAGGGAYPGLSGSDPVEERRYLVQRWRGGTLCDKTGQERSVEVQFHCNTQSTDRIALIRETAICEYVLVIHTPRLCGEPVFLGSESDLMRSTTLITRCQPILSSGALPAATTSSESSPDAMPASVAVDVPENPEPAPPAPVRIDAETPTPPPSSPSTEDAADLESVLDKLEQSVRSLEAANERMKAELEGFEAAAADADAVDGNAKQDFVVYYDAETGEVEVESADAAAAARTDEAKVGKKKEADKEADKPTIKSFEALSEMLQQSILKAVQAMRDPANAPHVLARANKHRVVGGAHQQQQQAGAKAPEQGRYVGSSKHHRLARMYAKAYDGTEEEEGKGTGRQKDEL